MSKQHLNPQILPHFSILGFEFCLLIPSGILVRQCQGYILYSVQQIVGIYICYIYICYIIYTINYLYTVPGLYILFFKEKSSLH